MLRHDKCHLSGIDAVHQLVDHDCQQKTYNHSVDNSIHIPKQKSTQKNDDHIRHERNFPDRPVRLQILDRHNNKVGTAGRGILHVNHRISQSGKHTGTECRKQTVSRVNREQWRDIVNHQGRNQHTAQ